MCEWNCYQTYSITLMLFLQRVIENLRGLHVFMERRN
jgi:hypothetical protein